MADLRLPTDGDFEAVNSVLRWACEAADTNEDRAWCISGHNALVRIFTERSELLVTIEKQRTALEYMDGMLGEGQIFGLTPEDCARMRVEIARAALTEGSQT